MGMELRSVCCTEDGAKTWQVDYKDKELDPSQIEPGWHAWMSYMVDKPPGEDRILDIGIRPWESKEPKINLTQSRGAYRPYSTYVALVYSYVGRYY
jgi:NADH:ubiquinone oxidoreductase subunit